MEESADENEDVESLFESDPERSNPAVKRRARKKKKRAAGKQNFDVEVIPAIVGVTPEGEDPPIKRVAAYCRVSTDEEAQASSFELQTRYYTGYIGSKEGWVLAGIYADEGISGTQVKHREQFMRMIEDCKAGKIDMVLTKSISRFSRNVVDCLTNIRMLKSLSPPVEVYFEKERLSSLDDKTDMVLSLMASIAQEESRSISANISWAIRNRMKDGTQKIPTSSLLGYTSDEDGNLLIVESEAETVKFIFKNFIQGMHPSIIAQKLNAMGKTTVMGNDWTGYSVTNILQNEKYCGDVLMQKTFTIDYLTHKTKKNEGERPQYFIADHHNAIVSHEVWNKAKELLDKMSWKRWKRRDQQRLIPLGKGVLKGYISISSEWKDVSITRLRTATTKFMEGQGGQMYELDPPDNHQTKEKENVVIMEGVLKNFEVIDTEVGKSGSTMTVMSKMLKFNKATAAELMYPEYVRMLINVPEKKVAIQACTEKTKNAVTFSKPADKQAYAITVKVPAIIVAIRKLMPDAGDQNSLVFHG